MVVNNDPEMLALFRDLLETEGAYRVTTRAYVNRGVDEIAALAPDLIVLDYMWAGEDGGWTLLNMLRAHNATAALPLVLCTAAVRQVEALERHLAELDVRVVLKPFRIAQLISAIEAGLGSTEEASP